MYFFVSASNMKVNCINFISLSINVHNVTKVEGQINDLDLNESSISLNTTTTFLKVET